MKLLNFWKTRLIRQKRAQVTPSRPGKAIAPKPFESLPRDQSRVLLLASLYWLEYEAWGILAMLTAQPKSNSGPNCAAVIGPCCANTSGCLGSKASPNRLG